MIDIGRNKMQMDAPGLFRYARIKCRKNRTFLLSNLRVIR